MRRIMCVAMGDANSSRPDAFRPLVEAQGKREPEIVRAQRMVEHWQKEYTGYDIPQAYWESLAGTAGKHGPASLMRHFLEKYDVGYPEPGLWVVHGRVCPVDRTMDLSQSVARQVCTVLWRQQTRRRLHLWELEQGRDEEAVDIL